MTDLVDLVPALKREVAVPGTFDTAFPNTSEDDLVGSLEDAFGAAQLDGFFSTQVLDVDQGTVTPDLSGSGAALVALYAAERIMQAKILTLRTRTSYQAGAAKYEVETAATVLTQILRDMRDRKNAILATALGLARASSSIYMQDQYSDRLTYFPGDYIGVDRPGLVPTNFFTYELARR